MSQYNFSILPGAAVAAMRCFDRTGRVYDCVFDQPPGLVVRRTRQKCCWQAMVGMLKTVVLPRPEVKGNELNCLLSLLVSVLGVRWDSGPKVF